jgi:RHS repeat-associated protein
VNTTDYVLEGQSVVRTLLNSAVDKTYLHGLRGPEYERVGAGNPSWYLYDGHGSAVGTVDQNGNVVSARKYDVYGAVRSLAGSSGSKHKFVGGLGHPSDDETGFVYMRARHYDPVTGRFASEDPARSGTNWYAYCANNPITFVDADGKEMSADQYNQYMFQLSLLIIGGGALFGSGALLFRMGAALMDSLIGTLFVGPYGPPVVASLQNGIRDAMTAMSMGMTRMLGGLALVVGAATAMLVISFFFFSEDDSDPDALLRRQ